jgi:hypothetical protein
MRESGSGSDSWEFWGRFGLGSDRLHPSKQGQGTISDFGYMAGFNAGRWVAVRRNGAATGDDAPGGVAFRGSGA